MRSLLCCLLSLWTATLFARPVLNVYNWADYLPNAVIRQFEKETGIQINYTEYDSNETLYTKLKSNPHLGYDVIFPSSYYVNRMYREHMLMPLDKTKLSNFKNLNPKLLHQNFDMNNQYSVPYLWGTTGIVVNKKFYEPKTVTSWGNFWDKRFLHQLLLFDDMRQVFAIALFHLGYSINEKDPKHIEEAYQQLKALWPNIKLFSVEAEQTIYIDEDAYIGIGLNGEIFNALSENKDLVYIYPREGFEVWMDCIAIPVNAPHLQAALQFINFLLRPDIAKKIVIATGFSTPNQSAVPLLPTNFRDNYILNPSNQTLNRGQFLIDLGETNKLYEKYWNQLKIGQ